MKIIAVEDETLFANQLEIFIDKLGYDLVGMTDNSEEMLRFFVSLKPDLALIDINIRGSKNGIEVAKKIAESQNPIPVIFITAYKDKEYFENAKAANPYAYIIKPFDADALERTIELAFARYAKTNHNENGEVWRNDILIRESFFIKIGDTLQKINIKDIIVVEVEGKNCTLCTSKDTFTVRMTLKEIADNLPVTDFIQVHRSYIVNANYIESINTKENTLKVLNKSIDISKNYKENLLQRINFLR
jgi:DNA-binding LytR/AlgR family response regulator